MSCGIGGKLQLNLCVCPSYLIAKITSVIRDVVQLYPYSFHSSFSFNYLVIPVDVIVCFESWTRVLSLSIVFLATNLLTLACIFAIAYRRLCIQPLYKVLENVEANVQGLDSKAISPNSIQQSKQSVFPVNRIVRHYTCMLSCPRFVYLLWLII